MSRASDMRAAAQAVEAYENASAYLKDGGPDGTFDVRVTWQWGASTTGYEELQREVQILVEANMGNFMDAAMKVLIDRADAALKDVGAAPIGAIGK